MAPKKKKDVSKPRRTNESIIGAQERVLTQLSYDDLDSIQAGRNPQLKKAYALRRLKLEELQAKMASLLENPSQKDWGKKVNSLSREIKIVTITDPTSMFRYNPNAKQERYRWTYYNEAKWKLATSERLPLAEGLKPLEAHHKLGVDKYFRPLAGLTDSELYFVHRDAAERGHYFGNNDLNRELLDKSRHVGRMRQGTPAYESIHGMQRYADLTDDQFADFVNNTVTGDPVYDVGAPGDPNIDAKRRPLPSYSKEYQEFIGGDYWDYTDIQDESSLNRLLDMADADKELLDKVLTQPTKTELLYSGEPTVKNKRIIKGILSRNPDISDWSEDMKLAMSNKDGATLLEAEDLNFQRRTAEARTRSIRGEPVLPNTRAKIASTLGDFSKTATGLSRAESIVRIAGGDVIGGTAGLAMTTPAFQKQIGKLLAKQGIKMIPGVSFGSGALQAVGYAAGGQWTKAGLSALGGVIGEFGPAGDAVQAAIDLGLTGHDIALQDINRVKVPDQDTATDAVKGRTLRRIGKTIK